MFVQVYFHRTRRFFDIMFSQALKCILPDGTYPQDVNDYLKWDDCRVIQELKAHVDDNHACANIVKRVVYSCANESVTHPKSGDRNEFKLISLQAKEKFGAENFWKITLPEKCHTKFQLKVRLMTRKRL